MPNNFSYRSQERKFRINLNKADKNRLENVFILSLMTLLIKDKKIILSEF